jgi:prepilin-type N-terminal cleavage/methylation domain-containing protein
MKVNKKIIGFTLNELIIVIVVLGVLAVTAATRFIDV